MADYLRHLWSKARHSSILRLVLDGLGRLGLRISPCYVILEGLHGGPIPELESGFDDCTMGFLGESDMDAMSRIPVRNFSRDELRRRLRDGMKCFGLKKDGELAAFTWCQFGECTHMGYRFSLKPNEAYFLDAFTLIEHRGKGYAPFVRYQCYKALNEIGVDRLYSISTYFNRPAIRFKLKLNAMILSMHLHIELVKRWRWTLQLRTYEEMRNDESGHR